MKHHHFITVALLTSGGLIGSQAAIAYQAGDIFVRGGIAKTDVASNNGEAAELELGVSNAHGVSFGAGYLFTDQLGVELNSSEKFEHDLTLGGGEFGSVDRMPVNLLVNYYPMGGLDSSVQPYAGVGINYSRFSGEDTLLPIDVRHSYGAVGQLGIDLAMAKGLMLNGYVSYADVSADLKLNGTDIGDAKIDPMTVGGGITYRF